LDILEVSTDDKKKIVPLGLLTKSLQIKCIFLSVHPSDIIEQPEFFFFILACIPQASSSCDLLLTSNIFFKYHGKMEA
jgi:hypothetical protein